MLCEGAVSPEIRSGSLWKRHSASSNWYNDRLVFVFVVNVVYDEDPYVTLMWHNGMFAEHYIRHFLRHFKLISNVD